MTDRELLQEALELMEVAIKAGDWKVDGACDPDMLFNSIRTRLAQPEPEPVAWVYKDEIRYMIDTKQNGGKTWETNLGLVRFEDDDAPLYTAPPKKEWVGLTDDDVNRFVDAIYNGFDIKPPNEIEIQYFERLIKFIDRKLKEKNNDSR
jgi:hypothetical protein